MSSATENTQKALVASAPERDEDRGPVVSRSGKDAGGFFTIRKKGQGYWTRMGTAGAAVLLIVLMARFIFTELPANVSWFNDHEQAKNGLVIGFILLSAFFAWQTMNKPQNVEFLISTDSEMKQVNWTSREELIGSTKVVILFMFIIAATLFITDVVFGYLFHWIGVLKNPPF